MFKCIKKYQLRTKLRFEIIKAETRLEELKWSLLTRTSKEDKQELYNLISLISNYRKALNKIK